MLKRFNSLQVKLTVMLVAIFLVILGTALFLFINIQKDHDIDHKIEFHVANSKNVLNYKDVLTQTFALLSDFGTTRDPKAAEKYIRLSHILANQYETLNKQANIGHGIRQSLDLQYRYYNRMKDLADQLFSTPIDAEREKIMLDIRALEIQMVSAVDEMSDLVYSEADSIFNERTSSYEHLLFVYIGVIILYIVLGFGGTLWVFFRNVSRPLFQFERAIRQMEKGNFSDKVQTNANAEFIRLAEVFNHMMAQIDELTQSLKDKIENIEEIVTEKTSKLNDAYCALEKKNSELKKLDELKDQFLQNISHELRTPLTSIIGYLDVVLTYQNMPVTQKNFLQIALQNSLSLHKIINDLLNITEIESGQMKLHLETVDLRQLVETVVTQIQIQADKKDLKLDLMIDPSVKDDSLFKMIIDPVRIESVVSNIIGNSIKFTPKGGISVFLTAEKESVMFQVKDTGIGMSRDDLDIIFDKFRQVDNSISKAYDGAGLGLPIAKRILELHQSEITVESVVGKGATVTVVLRKVFS